MSEDNNPYQTPGSDVSSERRDQILTTSTPALASGIIAFVALLLPAIGIRIGAIWWGAIMAACLGFGIYGLVQIYKNPDQYKGRGWAIWGLAYSAFIGAVVALSIADLI